MQTLKEICVGADQDAVTQIRPIKANKGNKERWIEGVSVLGNQETRSPGVYSHLNSSVWL